MAKTYLQYVPAKDFSDGLAHNCCGTLRVCEVFCCRFVSVCSDLWTYVASW